MMKKFNQFVYVSLVEIGIIYRAMSVLSCRSSSGTKVMSDRLREAVKTVPSLMDRGAPLRKKEEKPDGNWARINRN